VFKGDKVVKQAAVPGGRSYRGCAHLIWPHLSG